jgi:hypothetical protein
MTDAPRLTHRPIQDRMSRGARAAGPSRMTHGRATSLVVVSFLAAAMASCAKDVRVLRRRIETDSGRSIGVRPVSNPDAAGTSMNGIVMVDACPLVPCEGGAWNPATCSCDLPTNACEQGKTRYESSYVGENGSTLRLQSMPPMPMVGDNQIWTMSITLATGRPVPQGTSVSVICKMLHTGFSHGCPSNIEITRAGDTFTAAPINFNMQGDWQMTVKVGDLDVVTFGICAE